MMKVPYKWQRMAAKHNGILAGGCLRDLYHGRMPPKDVDIFVPGYEADSPDDTDYAEGFKVRDVRSAGMTYQIIQHRFNDIYEVLEHFDLGLCQIAYVNGCFVMTPAFLKDSTEYTITILRKSLNFGKHLASVRNRYPGYSVIDVNETEEMFN